MSPLDLVHSHIYQLIIVEQSQTNFVQLVILHRVSEHLRLVLSYHAVIHIRSRSQVMVNTSRNRLNTQGHCLFSAKIVFIFGLKDCHGVQ